MIGRELVCSSRASKDYVDCVRRRMECVQGLFPFRYIDIRTSVPIAACRNCVGEELGYRFPIYVHKTPITTEVDGNGKNGRVLDQGNNVTDRSSMATIECKPFKVSKHSWNTRL